MRKVYILGLLFMLTLTIIGVIGVYHEQQRNKTVETWAVGKELLDQLFFSIPNCTVPCWQSLIPDQTKRDDYLRIANELNEKGFAFRGTTPVDNYLTYSWLDPKNELFIYLNIEDEYLNNIEFVKRPLATIDVLFDTLGPPTHYEAKKIRDIEAIVSLNLFYADQGIVVGFDGFSPDQINDSCALMLSGNQSFVRLSFMGSGKRIESIYGSYNGYRFPLYLKPWTGLYSIQVEDC